MPNTYTYDQFPVFFYDNQIFAGEKSFHAGQCSVGMMNLNEEILDEIYRRVHGFLTAAQQLLAEKTDSAAAPAQQKLNAVWDVMFTLLAYQDLKVDEMCSYHAMENLLTEDDGRRSRCPAQRDMPCIRNFCRD